jgi:hypothetical protein
LLSSVFGVEVENVVACVESNVVLLEPVACVQSRGCMTHVGWVASTDTQRGGLGLEVVVPRGE